VRGVLLNLLMTMPESALMMTMGALGDLSATATIFFSPEYANDAIPNEEVNKVA
jgi:hypothetical protein